MAERYGSDFRRELLSAERFSDRAIARGLCSLKTPASRSNALLVRVTRPDHRLSLRRSVFDCGTKIVMNEQREMQSGCFENFANL